MSLLDPQGPQRLPRAGGRAIAFENSAGGGEWRLYVLEKSGIRVEIFRALDSLAEGET